jgi:hypothetical protein
VELASLVLDALTLTTAVVGVVWGLQQLHLANRHQRLELGNLYLQRYWSIDDELLVLEKGTHEHRHARHRYLRLCEDEFEAAKLEWLDRSQWTVWHSWLTTPSVRENLVADIEACDTDGKFFEHVRLCLGAPPLHNWGDCPASKFERDFNT